MTQMVSIIIPTFNRAHLLKRSINSVLQQTYSNFELIIIDDASTDNTREVIEGISDKRIRYIRNSNNKGAAGSRNIGIQNAIGEYITFQDSDDEWAPTKLEKQVNSIQSSPPEFAVVYTKNSFNQNGINSYIPSPSVKILEGDLYNCLLRNNHITIQALIKKTCFEKIGMFDESMPSLEDWDFWIRVSKHYLFKYIDEPLVNIYFQPGSVSSKRVLGLKILVDKYFGEMKRYRGLFASRLFEICWFLALKKNIKNSIIYYIKAVRFNPAFLLLLIPYVIALVILSLKNQRNET